MTSDEFLSIRHYLDKSQTKMAQLLGISARAVQSFEQGWRKVPAIIERQMLFFLYMKKAPTMKIKSCWLEKQCDLKTKQNCPVWEFQASHICWFINGAVCGGQVQENWNKKMQLCRQCKVFRSLFANV